jgi:hypothetical protein
MSQEREKGHLSARDQFDLALIGLLHALRLLYGWNVTIGEWAVPVWVSAVGFLIAGYLACQGFILKNKQG